jgi:hypothetical protein
MGLRSSSSWDKQDLASSTQSGWTDNSGKGLTPAQERMDKAASPLAGQQRSEVKPKEVTAEQRQMQTQQKEQEKEAQTQAKKQGFDPIEAQIEQATSKLTNFSSNLRSYVNQFLTGAASTAGFQDSSQPTYKIDPTTGMSELVFEDNVADTSAAAEQKRKEQAKIKEYLKSSGFAKEIAGKLYAKDFSEAMKDDDSKLGFDTKNKIDSTVNLLDRLEQLVQSGAGGSSEARAIEQQISSLDETGMVSGLRKARKDYSRIMGTGEKAERWYSAEGGEGFTALELTQIEGKKISEEVEKALTFGTGLFSGDFASNLKSLFDSESADIQASREKEAAAHEELQKGYKEWAATYGGDIKAKQDELNNRLKEVARDMAAEASRDDDMATAAIWMDAMSEGNLTEYFTKMINDPKSGLSTEERQKIGNALASVMGDAKDPMSAMHQLATTGSIKLTLPKEGGGQEQITVKPSAREKLNLLSIMQDATLTSEERNTKLKAAMDNLQVGSGKLSEYMSKAMDIIKKTGVNEAGISAFKNAIKTSLKSFAGSKTEAALRLALGISDEQWNTLDEKGKRAEIKRIWEALTPEQKKNIADKITAEVNTANENMKGQVETNNQKINSEMERINGILDNANTQMEKYKEAGQAAHTKYLDGFGVDGTGHPAVKASTGFNPKLYGQGSGSAEAALAKKEPREAFLKDSGYPFTMVITGGNWDDKVQSWFTGMSDFPIIYEDAVSAAYPGGSNQLQIDAYKAYTVYKAAKDSGTAPQDMLDVLWGSYRKYLDLNHAIIQEINGIWSAAAWGTLSEKKGLFGVKALGGSKISGYIPPADAKQRLINAIQRVGAGLVPDSDLTRMSKAERDRVEKNPMLVPEYTENMNRYTTLQRQAASLAATTVPELQKQIKAGTALLDSLKDDETFSPDDIVGTAIRISTGTRGTFDTNDNQVGDSGEILFREGGAGNAWRVSNPNLPDVKFDPATGQITGATGESFAEVLMKTIQGPNPKSALELLSSPYIQKALGKDVAKAYYDSVVNYLKTQGGKTNG